jgi:hypothetical protein
LKRSPLNGRFHREGIARSGGRKAFVKLSSTDIFSRRIFSTENGESTGRPTADSYSNLKDGSFIRDVDFMLAG